MMAATMNSVHAMFGLCRRGLEEERDEKGKIAFGGVLSTARPWLFVPSASLIESTRSFVRNATSMAEASRDVALRYHCTYRLIKELLLVRQ